ncbi:1-pyrroline-5-carboxylate dehydrogenase [Vibrio viridaestus]|uniref:1-pyrroline-5-carboxylate dehydrogenase n=1 Tax=Vibrio viridaestus TaxID=2487322 RepID=A0A3N9TL21_9VIBR|nr:1-pyrroline-5-carboxylate dehydrogenase [Vibrio viridaestus]RQW65049.1 1-pyrroline-5-carboxylate dehydrogenase [Vibrio viridaestus]
MVHQAARFSDSFSAWENWNLLGYEQRKQSITDFALEVAKSSPAYAAVIDYQIRCGQEWLSESQLMPGPTGETNELYTAGRGVTLVVQEKDSEPAVTSLFALLTAALLSGNSVMVCSDNLEVTNLIRSSADKASLPAHIILTSALDARHSLLNEDIRSLAYVGDADGERIINSALAQKTGAIASFISETDLVNQPTAQDPTLCLRFITERTRTINITAIGGNASLLELGSDAH